MGEATTASADAGSRRATIAAFLSNLGVAAAKFVAFFFTGSASMLAEGVHSVADTANQGLLLFGGFRARRNATQRHPFGYGRERYFWAFVVAMILFSAGALFALVEGEEKLRQPHELTRYPWAAGVLVVSMVFEAISLRTAVLESRTSKTEDESWLEFVRRTPAPELAVVLLEDTGALIGLVIALIGTTAAEITGRTRFDALGSIGIGLLLGAIALTLAKEMKSMLIGESATAEDLRSICDAILDQHEVQEILDLRTEQLGPDSILVVGNVTVRSSSLDTANDVMTRTAASIRTAVPSAQLVYLLPHASTASGSDRSGSDGSGPAPEAI